MFRLPGLLSPWRDFAPNACGEAGAAMTYSEVYAGYATQEGKGHWVAIRFKPAGLASGPSPTPEDILPEGADLPRHIERATFRRGFVNSDSLASTGRQMYQRYAISVAQALFPRIDFVLYLERHFHRRSSTQLHPRTSGRIHPAMFAPSTRHTFLLRLTARARLAPTNTAYGPATGGVTLAPIALGNSMGDMSPSSRQHSAAEYMDAIISYIGRVEEYLGSFLPVTTPRAFYRAGRAAGCIAPAHLAAASRWG